jgi:hypothetical protein
LIKTHVTRSYGALYTSDLPRSCKWYYEAFGFQIVAINSDFATIEIAPGRLMFLEREDRFPRKLSFKTRNIKALKRQLNEAEINIEQENELFITVCDPDGNILDVYYSGFGTEWLSHSLPDRFVRDLIRCRIESMGKMHLLARQISDDTEFKSAGHELQQFCQQHNISIDDDPIIASKYTQQVDTMFACLPVTIAPTIPLPAGMTCIHIPACDYSVFPISYLAIDDLRTSHLIHRVQWMNNSFTRPESFYILEYYKDDNIHMYFPYEWDKGWQEISQ